MAAMYGDQEHEKPSLEEYTEWYDERFQDNLQSGKAERWYDIVTDSGLRKLQTAPFWTELQNSLTEWNAGFQAEHEGNALFEVAQQPTTIEKKSFESVLNKSFRRNVLKNDNWPNPPKRLLKAASDITEYDPDDSLLWFGPNNWLTDFPDIFRVRLLATYFDGVGHLVEKIRNLAHETSSTSPKWKLKASHDGYHAAHIWVNHEIDTVDYENSDPVSVPTRLEIQVTTTIQATIIKSLHRVYESWRLKGPPTDWEWDHKSTAFSVNYLASTLHYLEGMIVIARDEGGTN